MAQSFLHYTTLLATAFLLLASGAATAQSFEPTSGPEGGWMTSLTHARDGAIFAGGKTSRIYRSTDDGRSWQNRSHGLPVGSINILLAHPNGMMFASFGQIVSNQPSASGIFRSVDKGASWQLMWDLPAYVISDLLLGPDSSLFVVVSGYTYRSTDNGNSWKQITVHEVNTFTRFLATDGGVMYAMNEIDQGTEYVLHTYRSMDNGQSWNPYGDTLPVISPEISNISRKFLVTPRGALFLRTNFALYRLAKDSTWQQVGSGLPPNTNLWDPVVAPDSSLYLTTSAGVYRSTDDGFSWSNPTTGSDNVDGNPIEFTAAGTILVGGIDRLYRSQDNGQSWQPSTTGITSNPIRALATTREGVVLTASQSGVYRSSDRGGSWIRLPIEMPSGAFPVRVAVQNDGTMFCGTGHLGAQRGLSGGSIYRSTNGGDSWSAATVGLVAGYVTSIRCTPGRVFVGTDSGFYRSTNNGTSWERAITGLPGLYINTIARTAKGTLCVSVQDAGMYRSTDNGDHWYEANTGLHDPTLNITALPNGTVLAFTSSRLYRSTDDGVTWTQLTSPLPPDVSMSAMLSNQQNVVFMSAQSMNRMYSSTDNGESWTEAGTVNSPAGLSLDSTGRLYIGTNDNGVWRSTGSTITSVNEDSSSKDGLQLRVFSSGGKITLHYSTPCSGATTLALFDLSGWKVRTLMDDWHEAGEQHLMIHATDLPSGVYHARLQVGEQVATTKIVVTR